jgi:hypothetical protein
MADSIGIDEQTAERWDLQAWIARRLPIDSPRSETFEHPPAGKQKSSSWRCFSKRFARSRPAARLGLGVRFTTAASTSLRHQWSQGLAAVGGVRCGPRARRTPREVEGGGSPHSPRRSVPQPHTSDRALAPGSPRAPRAGRSVAARSANSRDINGRLREVAEVAARSSAPWSRAMGSPPLSPPDSASPHSPSEDARHVADVEGEWLSH